MILSIDSSTSGCSVALFHNGVILGSEISSEERSAAESLTLMIERILKQSGISFSQLEAVAVAKGPGSYTGLRIAVSTAKGLAFGLKIPLISYGTLDAMCFQVAENPARLLCPMIDARRMEVFCAFFDGQSKQAVSDVEAVLVEERSFEEILGSGEVLFFGEGSAKCKDVIKHKMASFYECPVFPTAASALEIVESKFRNKEFEDLVTFEPFYLKEYMFKTKKPLG